MNKRLIALALTGLLVGAIFAPTAARADTAIGVVECTTDEFVWPGGTDSGNPGFSCNGTATGVHGTSACVMCDFEAKVTFYAELCDLGLPPLAGFANGEILLDSAAHGTFDWVRVGLVAVLVPVATGADSAGVAVFVPEPSETAVPSCAVPDEHFKAVVAGAGALDLL